MIGVVFFLLYFVFRFAFQDVVFVFGLWGFGPACGTPGRLFVSLVGRLSRACSVCCSLSACERSERSIPPTPGTPHPAPRQLVFADTPL